MKKAHTLFKSLENLFKCPGCSSDLQASLSLCRNGHGLCEVCKDKFKGCPLCKEEIIQLKRNTLFKNVFANLPKLCPFTGCEMVTFEGLENHKKVCEYRPTRCKVVGCEWTGNVKNLTAHLGEEMELEEDTWRECNGDHFPLVKSNYYFPHSCLYLKHDYNSISIPYDFPLHEDFYEYTPVLTNKGFFWIYCHRNASSKLITFSLIFVPTKNSMEIFYLVVSLEIGKLDFKCTFRSILDTDDVTELENDISGMVISDSNLVDFSAGKNNYFTCKIEQR